MSLSCFSNKRPLILAKQWWRQARTGQTLFWKYMLLLCCCHVTVSVWRRDAAPGNKAVTRRQLQRWETGDNTAPGPSQGATSCDHVREAGRDLRHPRGLPHRPRPRRGARPLLVVPQPGRLPASAARRRDRLREAGEGLEFSQGRFWLCSFYYLFLFM